MKNVRIDSTGELRCWNCGARGFTEKRTLRAKALGGVTVGVGALVAKKKLRCQGCGKYNDVGNAKPFEGETATPATVPAAAAPAPAPEPAPAAPAADDPAQFWAASIDPVTATGWRATATFNGATVLLEKKFGAPRRREYPITDVVEVHLLDLGKDGVGLWFALAGEKAPKPKIVDVQMHEAGIGFDNDQRADAERLLAAVEAQRINGGGQ